MRNFRGGFTVLEILFVVGIFILMTIVLAPVIKFAKSRANTANCATNLRKISLGLHEYAARNNDAFPPDLGALCPEYVNDEKAFDCPATKKIGSKTRPDYDYTAGLTETSSPDEIIVRDEPGSHGRSGGNALRVSGAVEWVK